MVLGQTQDSQTQDRPNPRQAKPKTVKPKTGQTQDRSNPRQVKPKTGSNPRQGQTQDNILFSTQARGGPGGGLNFVFKALRPAVSEIGLDILQKFFFSTKP